MNSKIKKIVKSLYYQNSPWKNFYSKNVSVLKNKENLQVFYNGEKYIISFDLDECDLENTKDEIIEYLTGNNHTFHYIGDRRKYHTHLSSIICKLYHFSSIQSDPFAILSNEEAVIILSTINTFSDLKDFQSTVEYYTNHAEKKVISVCLVGKHIHARALESVNNSLIFLIEKPLYPMITKEIIDTIVKSF